MQFLASCSRHTLCSIQHVNSVGQRQPFTMNLPKTYCNGNCESGAKDTTVTQLNNSVKTMKRIKFLKHYLHSQTHFTALTTLSLTYLL